MFRALFSWGPFSSSFGNINIVHVVDYVLKWVETKAYQTDDFRIVADFIKCNIFARFGTPKSIISDRGTYFCNRSAEAFFWSTTSLTRSLHLTIYKLLDKLKCLTEMWNQSLKRQLIWIEKIGAYGLMMYFGLIEPHTRCSLVCHVISCYMVSLVICWWNLNIKHDGYKTM